MPTAYPAATVKIPVRGPTTGACGQPVPSCLPWRDRPMLAVAPVDVDRYADADLHHMDGLEVAPLPPP